MSTRDLALAGLEQVLNAYLGMDPEAAARLAPLHGKVIAIELSGLELTLYFIPNADGTLQVQGSVEGEPDCTLRGSPVDLWRSSGKEAGPRQLFAGHVQISGDTALAQRFGAVLGGADIDWEEQLSRISGDVIAHEVGRQGRRAARYLEQGVNTVQANLGEYLSEEARLLPTRIEAKHFCDDIDTLRDDTERLAARLALLESRLASKGET